MLQAQISITAAKTLSAIRPLGRLLRNSRIGEGAASPGTELFAAASSAGTRAGICIEEPGSRSVVMRVGGKVFFLQL